MMEGVLRHCTDMAIERQYVDSHGQSEVAFAFSYILGFDLLPRFKAIAKQKLSLVASTDAAEYPNLEPILTRAINREFDSATVRRNHQVYDRTETGHGRTGSHPPPLYPWRCGASDLQRR